MRFTIPATRREPSSTRSSLSLAWRCSFKYSRIFLSVSSRSRSICETSEGSETSTEPLSKCIRTGISESDRFLHSSMSERKSAGLISFAFWGTMSNPSRQDRLQEMQSPSFEGYWNHCKRQIMARSSLPLDARRSETSSNLAFSLSRNLGIRRRAPLSWRKTPLFGEDPGPS